MADSSTATDIRCNPRSVPQVLLVQIEDEDDNLTGMSGAIGRLETNDERQEICLDLNGRLYRGKIYSGTTAMVLQQQQQHWKLDGITSEFCRMKPVETPKISDDFAFEDEETPAKKAQKRAPALASSGSRKKAKRRKK